MLLFQQKRLVRIDYPLLFWFFPERLTWGSRATFIAANVDCSCFLATSKRPPLFIRPNSTFCSKQYSYIISLCFNHEIMLTKMDLLKSWVPKKNCWGAQQEPEKKGEKASKRRLSCRLITATSYESGIFVWDKIIEHTFTLKLLRTWLWPDFYEVRTVFCKASSDCYFLYCSRHFLLLNFHSKASSERLAGELIHWVHD